MNTTENVRRAQARIEQALRGDDPAVLLLSGGKDALACLYLARPWWDRIHIVWGNAGDEVPEIRQLMTAIRAQVPNFLECRGHAIYSQADYGWPVDMLPMEALLQWRPGSNPDSIYPALIGKNLCCDANVWTPLKDMINECHIRLVIRGDRDDEDTRNTIMQDGQCCPGTSARLVLPIVDWTADQVFSYLKAEGVTIPNFYRYGGKSLDCLHCTAWLHGDENRLTYLRDLYPDAAREVERRLRLIDRAQEHERRVVGLVLENESSDIRTSVTRGGT